MHKKLLVIGLMIVFLSVGLSGCTSEKRESLDAHKFIGSWVVSEILGGEIKYIYTFYSNGSLLITTPAGNESVIFNWEWESSQLIIRNETNVEFIYNYSLSEDELMVTLTDMNNGDSLFLIKH